MKKRVKLVVFALIAVVLAGYGIYAATRPLEVDTIVIEPRHAHMYFIQQGYGVQGSLVSVYPLVGGEIISLEVREGDRITAGDVICRVDLSALELLILRSETNIAALEAQVRNLQLNETRERNALTTSRNDLMSQMEILNARSDARVLSIQEQVNLQETINRQLESTLEQAVNNYRNMEVLYAVQAVSRVEYDTARNRVEEAQSQLDQGVLALSGIYAGTSSALGSEGYFEAARAAIDTQMAGINRSLATNYSAAMEDYFQALIEGEHVNIAQLRRDMESGVIRTHVSGRIESLPAQEINIISPNTPIAVIRTDDEVSVEVFVRTRDVVNLNIGDTVEVIFKARGNNIVFPGNIVEIGDRAEGRMSPLGIVDRNVKVSISIPENEIIRDGYDVDVRFTYFEASDRMVVPRTALFTHEGRDMIWVLAGGQVEMREVALGAELRIDTVIEAGLQFGDVVIRDANDNRLREGVAAR